MKLTPSCQGYRFRREGWPESRHVDMRVVGKPDKSGVRFCRAFDEDGNSITFRVADSDSSWTRLGSTRKLQTPAEERAE